MNDVVLAMPTDSFSSMPRGKQILSIAAEMNRAGHWLSREDLDEARRCHMRAVILMDKILEGELRSGEIREYGIWRNEVAKFITGNPPSIDENSMFERCVIQLHPDSWNAFFPRSNS